MPCWFYEKKDLRVTPSLKDGINPDTEARYRREGARFIIDTGTKMGLRYDTCATGVVYFHRFYMFHSFREFHRYVTAACCLFLAGKVEETPKKCKDIIKITKSMLTDSQFAVFGDDPREEVMTMERILLQTIKFDLMVEHPYAYLLKLAKLIKGDKDKTQKLVQMAWTFVNDSLCTMLCLQWEPDIIAVALMYLASRLTKVEVTDWQGKVSGQKVKWYEGLVEDATLEILEDVCHQVLDLYSTTPQASREDSPPPPPPPKPKPVSVSPVPTKVPSKRSRSPSPVKTSSSTKTSRQSSPVKQQKMATPTVDERPQVTNTAITATALPAIKQLKQSSSTATLAQPAVPTMTYTQSNPYMTSKMYSSFMSGEGSNAIQTLIGGQPVPAPAPTAAAPVVSTYAAVAAAQPPAVQNQYAAAAQQQQPPGRSMSATYSASAGYQGQAHQQATSYSHQYQGTNSSSAPPLSGSSYSQTQYGQQAPPHHHHHHQQQPTQQQQQQPAAVPSQHPAAQQQSYGQYSSYPPPPPQQQQPPSQQQQSSSSYSYQQQQQQPPPPNQQQTPQNQPPPPPQQQYNSPYAQPSASGLYSQQLPPRQLPIQQQQQQHQSYGHYGAAGGGAGGGGGMSQRSMPHHQHPSSHHHHHGRSNIVRMSNRLPPRR